MIKRFLHRWFHFWDAPLGRTLSLVDVSRPFGGGFCIIRKCTVCEKVEVNTFATFGDKKWYGLDTIGLHIWDTEQINILRALRHHKEIEPECPESFYPAHHHSKRLIESTETGTSFACKCPCGCVFNWISPCDWEIKAHGIYFTK